MKKRLCTLVATVLLVGAGLAQAQELPTPLPCDRQPKKIDKKLVGYLRDYRPAWLAVLQGRAAEITDHEYVAALLELLRQEEEIKERLKRENRAPNALEQEQLDELAKVRDLAKRRVTASNRAAAEHRDLTEDERKEADETAARIVAEASRFGVNAHIADRLYACALLNRNLMKGMTLRDVLAMWGKADEATTTSEYTILTWRGFDLAPEFPRGVQVTFRGTGAGAVVIDWLRWGS